MKRKPTNANNIKKADLSLLDFLKQSNTVPGKIVFFENIEGLDTSGYFYIQGLALFLIEKGYSTIEVNTKTYELKKGCIFVAFPGQIIHVISISDDIKPLCIACSMDMMNDLMSQVKDSIQLFQQAKQSPFQQRDGEDFEQIKKIVQTHTRKNKSHQRQPLPLSNYQKSCNIHRIRMPQYSNRKMY